MRQSPILYSFETYSRFITHIAQNTAETYLKYFKSYIAIEILSQHYCQVFQNNSWKHYNFNILKYFWKQINIR